MATVSDYIRQSLRLTGILGENDPVTAEQGADGLVVLNDMVGNLRGKGIELGIAPQDSTTNTLLVPEEDRLEFKYLLAVYLCMNYGRTPTPAVIGLAQSGFDKFLRRAVLNDELVNNAAIPLGEGSRGYGFNITTGLFG